MGQARARGFWLDLAALPVVAKHLARRGRAVERPIDVIKDPVVIDFLDLPESELLRERDLENRDPRENWLPPRTRD